MTRNLTEPKQPPLDPGLAFADHAFTAGRSSCLFRLRPALTLPTGESCLLTPINLPFDANQSDMAVLANRAERFLPSPRLPFP